ncbi:MAG: hypothetical protein KDD89_07160 [Anaerolineales bacterium]|nr:hypothetical protein [Anaerolineales bacterium]
MTIYDPGNYDNQPDEGTSPWVWVLLGLGALVFCCVAAAVVSIAGLALMGSQTEQVFEEIATTLEADAPPVVATVPVVSESENGVVATVVPTAVSETNTAVGRVNYLENFSEADEWGTGSITAEDDDTVIEAEAIVNDGAFDFTVHASESLFWSTASENFEDGVYEVRATAVDGPLDNGFGMIFMFDNDRDNFYMFEVSSDGYVWVGRYEQGGEVIDAFLEDGWLQSGAVNQGLNASNLLRVEVDNGQMTFYVNDQRVASATDTSFSGGNIGVFVETFSEGGARVLFDDFTYISR